MSTLNDNAKGNSDEGVAVDANSDESKAHDRNSTILEDVDATVEAVTKKRKMPTFKDIISKADEKVKRKLVPVKSWDTLNMNSVYLVKSVHEMEISLKSGEEKTTSYICVKDDDENIMNIWISEMISEKLDDYAISDENTYIIPLGKKKSKKTGYDYNDFAIVTDSK